MIKNNTYILSALLIMAMTLLTIVSSGCSKGNNISPGKVALSEEGLVRFAVSDFADGKARHYKLENNGISIRFFIVRSSDGVIRTAFDACDVCWQSDKGYIQQDDYMICRNCGMSFRTTGINVIRGGCNPAPLTSKIEGEYLYISKHDFAEGEKYFDFKSGGGK